MICTPTHATAIRAASVKWLLSYVFRLYLTARPMEDGLAEAIDEGKIGPRDDPKTRGKVLTDDFGWDKVQQLDAACDHRASPLVLQAVQALQCVSCLLICVMDSCACKLQLAACLRRWDRRRWA